MPTCISKWKKSLSFKSLKRLVAFTACFFSAGTFSGCVSEASDPIVLYPGTDIAIIDAYFSTSTYLPSVILVFRNNTVLNLSYLQIDYRLECDAGDKNYGTESISFTSNEQERRSYSVENEATSCTYTILAIRPSPYTTDSDYADWTGTYTINILKQ